MMFVIAESANVVPRSCLVTLETLNHVGAGLTSHFGRNHLAVHLVATRGSLVALRAIRRNQKGAFHAHASHLIPK